MTVWANRYVIYIFLLGLFVSSCRLEKAGTERTQQLVIASDFLNDKDESLFKDFEKEHEIRIHILHISADSINQKLEKEGYSTKIDLVLLRSALDLCDLKASEKLQRIVHKEDIPTVSKRFADNEGFFYGIGINPFIIVAKIDSNTRKIANYKDLGKINAWSTNLKENNDFLPLMNGMAHRMREESSESFMDWSTSLFSKEIEFRKGNDSSGYLPPLLTTYSAFYSDSALLHSGYRKAQVLFPNQQNGGLFYELRAVAIVKQARNYSNALEFIHYITESSVNQRINSWWNTFPITTSLNRSYSYQNKRFKSYSIPVGKMCSTREKASRMIKKVRKK